MKATYNCDVHGSQPMNNFQTHLLQTLAKQSKLKNKKGNQGFTLVELLIVTVIIGILSAVAMPQFFAQTKKAAATEGTQQASAIAKQASAYYLENGAVAAGQTHTNCSAYAGALKTDNTNFTYSCAGTKDAFVVNATGKADNDNTKDVVVRITANLTDGTFSKPVITGV